ncbi:hypothetical protein SSYRP_v1c09660 [Spiroplasma syrphidicola EA-1]|uniref:Uncharacterized protein n=1 Tax=Spiroplasma syrphidicola EA-1 TaxID=1276229 RepID=R4U7C1_9MOLU|nr:hypothetical protein [Spiroplasma syrphidicola]AGM26553.1 hypothetical protein SSYRP_v1c09660 [Spiroplasma syrphidicola EA-1]
MKIGVVKIFKKWRKLSVMVGYQTPKRPSFFQYLILNAIANYPDKNASLKDILQQELQLQDLRIYQECLKDLIEKEEIIEINTQTSFNYLSASYNKTDWIDSAIGIFHISPAGLETLEKGFLIGKNQQKEIAIEFLIDDFSGEIIIAPPQLALIATVKDEQLTITSPTVAKINSNDLLNVLETVKLSGQSLFNFNKDTIFNSLRIGKEHLTTSQSDFDLGLYTVPGYEVVEVNLTLTTFKDLKMHVNNLQIQNLIDSNQQLREKITTIFINTINFDLKQDFTLSNRQIPASAFETDYYQDPRMINPMLVNAKIVIVNNDLLKEEKLLAQKYYHLNNFNCLILVNNDKKTTLTDLSGSLPIFRFATNDFNLAKEFLILFANYKQQSEVYNFQKLDLITYNKNLTLVNKYQDDYGAGIYKTISKQLMEQSKYLISKWEELADQKQDDLILTFIYLLDLLNDSEEAMLGFIKIVVGSDYSNKVGFLQSWQEKTKAFQQKPNYQNLIHSALLNLLEQMATTSSNIIEAYRILSQQNILPAKEILAILQKYYNKNNVSLEELLELSAQCDPLVLEKIWNQNLFHVLNKVLFALSVDNIEQYFNKYRQPSGDVQLLNYLYSFTADYLKYFGEMNRRDINNIQRYWPTIWSFVNVIIERFSHFETSFDLSLQLLHALSKLEYKFRTIKYENMFNSEAKFQEYLDAGTWGRAALYLANLLEEKLDHILKNKMQGVKYLNEKLFILKKEGSKEQAKRIIDLYEELKLYLYCDQGRNEVVPAKNRDLINKWYQEIKEVFK